MSDDEGDIFAKGSSISDSEEAYFSNEKRATPTEDRGYKFSTNGSNSMTDPKSSTPKTEPLPTMEVKRNPLSAQMIKQPHCSTMPSVNSKPIERALIAESKPKVSHPAAFSEIPQGLGSIF